MAGHDTPTQPGWVSAPLRKEKKQVPWWAAALLSGVGIGLTLVTALGLNAAKGAEVQQQPPHVQAASVALPPGSISLDERLHNIETAIRALTTELTEVKQRLPPKHLP